jgi:hypothetical protein
MLGNYKNDEKCMVGLTSILKEAWNTSANTEDNGATFGAKINLSNSTKSESQDAQIAASGDRVFVTWWERNATSNEPFLRISNDNGKTFGEMFRLSANGTTGSSGGG